MAKNKFLRIFAGCVGGLLGMYFPGLIALTLVGILSASALYTEAYVKNQMINWWDLASIGIPANIVILLIKG